MVLEIVIPERNEKGSVKDLVFTILSEDREKTLTQLHKEMKKKFGVSVSFQAVMKAVSSLVESDVLVRKRKLYSLNKNWIFETRSFFDKLYSEHFKVKKPMKRVEMGKEITVYTVHNLLELDKLWNELLMSWAKSERKDKRNCWKGRHAWWVVPRLQEEDLLHDFMIEQGVKTYNLWTRKTPLDRMAAKYYSKKNEHAKFRNKRDSEKDEHIAAFGDTLIKFEIPSVLSKKLDRIYSKTKRIEDLDVKEAIDLFKENVEIEFVVIRDRFLADSVKEDIISSFS